MNIVVLDGYTLNPGDLSWEALEALGECRIHDRTPPGLTVKRAANAEIVLTNKTVLDRRTIERLPKLRYIGVLATGHNVVDLQAARERKIPVTNVPAYATPSAAQMTFALLLELCRHVGDHARGVRDGRWTASRDFCYWDHPMIELNGLVMGVVGFGRIGRAVAELARAFGMSVLAHDPTIAFTETQRGGTGPACLPHLPTCLPSGGQAGGGRAPPRKDEAEFVNLDDLFRRADVVSLHCPLTAETQDLVNARTLALMKKTAFLINTSRGPLVDQQALADTLNAGRIAGAGLDVLAVEPPPGGNPLLTARNCLITPHIAWATHSARQRLMAVAVDNVRAFLAGSPRNVVN